MKKYVKFLLPIVVLVLLIFVFVNKGEEREGLDIAVNDELEQMCFLYERESDLVIETLPLQRMYDREYSEFTSKDGVTVQGIHNIIPAGIDSNRATFVGVQQDGYMNVIATANAEGETWQEQRLYQIQNDRLLVGYQQVYVPRYQDENGIYFYEDLNKISFETEEFALQKVDCSTIPAEVKV